MNSEARRGSIERGLCGRGLGVVCAAAAWMVVACGAPSRVGTSHPNKEAPVPTQGATPASAHSPAQDGLRDVGRDEVRVTSGQILADEGLAMRIDEPEVRAVVPGSRGLDVELAFAYLGPTREVSRLASGAVRRQLGLKLLAADGCNLLYAMLRIEPGPALVVSVKRNPGQRTHAECGARGYRNISPQHAAPLPPWVASDAMHALRATLSGSTLRVRLDGVVVWEGDLGNEIDGLDGPVGIRTDNVRARFSLRADSADRAASRLEPTTVFEDGL